MKDNILIEKLDGLQRMPRYGRVGDGAFDLWLPELRMGSHTLWGYNANFIECSVTTADHGNNFKLIVGPGCFSPIIPLRFKMKIPDGKSALIIPRGSSVKDGKTVVLANTVGLVDSNYIGEVFIRIYNPSTHSTILQSENAIAQCTIVDTPQYDFEVVESLKEEVGETARGEGCTGSSDGI